MGFELNGIIVSGLKEAAKFLAMPEYEKAIEKILGSRPYPGTLNIKTQDFKKEMISHPLRFEGFERQGKKFSGITLTRASINNIQGLLVFPDINRQQKDVMEFIASINMRKEFDLKDNEKITVHIE